MTDLVLGLGRRDRVKHLPAVSVGLSLERCQSVVNRYIEPLVAMAAGPWSPRQIQIKASHELTVRTGVLPNMPVSVIASVG